VTLLSVTARYQITPNVSVQFNGNNLLDKKYYILDDFDNTSFGAPASYALGVNVRL
jgi:outer membrane receptor for ferric coprogen and ferric-rhodotorulic acid